MKPEEYVKTIAYNGHMVNIGNDDYGQQYFIEYVDDDGNLCEVGCGAYNFEYMEVVEHLLGKPELCDKYNKHNFECPCETTLDHGYCYKCPNNEFVVARIKRDLNLTNK